MIINSVSEFIDRILQLWPPYRWDEVQEKAWVDIMVRELSGFKPPVLDRGFQELVRRRKESKIPTPAECIAICTEAKRWVEAQENNGKLPSLRSSSYEWSKEREDLADQLIRCGLGRQAAKDKPCWVRPLWHFCRRNQRLPMGQEIEQCKRGARDLDEGRGMLAEIRPSPAMPQDILDALTRLGDSMVAKNKQQATEVLRHG